MRKPWWAIPLLVAALVAAGDQAAAPATRGSTWKPAGGPFATEVTSIHLRDGQRDKDLPLLICHPKGNGPFPLVVFSHGAGSVGEAYRSLAEYWASHGYILILPTHADSLALDKDPDALRNWEQHMGRVIEQVLKDPDGWGNRVRDVRFVLDSLPEIERQVAGLKGKIDSKRIGVGGHSYGALVAQVIGGATIDLPGKPAQILADPRVRCIVLLSAQGRGQMGLSEHSWDKLAVPMLCLAGTLDFGASGQGPQWRMEPFKFAPAGDKYAVSIEGANHFSFSGRETALPQRAGPMAIQQYIQCSTLAFWDAFLGDDPKARAWLASDELEKYSDGVVKMWRK